MPLASALGVYFAQRRMLKPLDVLTRYVEQIGEGRVGLVSADHRRVISREFGDLLDRLDAMERAFSERQILAAHLAEQEKRAMLGQLASGMAHEVNNPIAGMFSAIDTIEAYGHEPAVRKESLDFLKRGLAGIRNVVRATLVTYKGGSDPGVLAAIDLDDLPFLAQHACDARHLRLDWDNQIAEPLAIDGPAVRQITLNLLLNACAASLDGGIVAVTASYNAGQLQIAVADSGPGLPEDMAALLHRDVLPPLPSPESRGLGLWTTGNLVHRLGGHVDIEYPGVAGRRRSCASPHPAAVRHPRNPLHSAAAIGLAVGTVLGRRKMAKRFRLSITDNQLAFAREEAEIAAEAQLDGIYVLRTSLSPFRSLKSIDLAIRPMFHWTALRVRAYVFSCLLAYTPQGSNNADPDRRAGNQLPLAPASIGIGGVRIDRSVAAQIVEAVSQHTIEAAILAADQPLKADNEARQALCGELEEARYEASLAARRYEVVDPTKRLVARELETRWNSAGARRSSGGSHRGASPKGRPRRADGACPGSAGSVECARHGRPNQTAHHPYSDTRGRARTRRQDQRGAGHNPLERRTSY